MRVLIERDGCIGCSLCASICPAVFRMDEENLAEVYQEPSADALDAVREAEDGCPVSVIHVEA